MNTADIGRPVAPLYRAIMLEIERRRLQTGIPMDDLCRGAGVAERGYAKSLYPETSSGRLSRWSALQLLIDFLFIDGFDLEIRPKRGPQLTAVCSKLKIKAAAANFQRPSLRQRMRELAALAAEARRKIPPAKRRDIARRAGIASGQARIRRRAAASFRGTK